MNSKVVTEDVKSVREDDPSKVTKVIKVPNPPIIQSFKNFKIII